MSDPTPVEQHPYELVYILQPKVEQEAVQALDQRLTDLVVKGGGKVLGTEHWGQRRLAYPIKKHFEGYYVLHRLQMPAATTQPLERTLGLTEDIIRFLLLHADQ